MSKFDRNIDKMEFEIESSKNPDDFSHLAKEVSEDLGAADDKIFR